MKKNRHSWGELKTTDYAEYQQCIKCGLFRHKALGIWHYADKSPERKNLETLKFLPNNGCI